MLVISANSSLYTHPLNARIHKYYTNKGTSGLIRTVISNSDYLLAIISCQGIAEARDAASEVVVSINVIYLSFEIPRI